MAKAIFIVGLPGSGKTYYVCDLASEINAEKFDDFKADAIDNCSHFTFARRYEELINKLRSGLDAIISDIDFCKTESRDEARQCIEQQVQGVEFEWIFFENDPEKCRKNIIRREKTRGRSEPETIKKLEMYSKKYEIPDGSFVEKVWDGD